MSPELSGGWGDVSSWEGELCQGGVSPEVAVVGGVGDDGGLPDAERIHVPGRSAIQQPSVYSRSGTPGPTVNLFFLFSKFNFIGYS